MKADMWDDEDGISRDVGGQYQEKWAVKRQQCPNWRNENVDFNGSVSASRRGLANIEAFRPEYRMREHNNRNGVSDGLSDA